MRDAGLRDIIRKVICAAVVRQKDAEHDAGLDNECERHLEPGGDEGDWKPRPVDRGTAEAAGRSRRRALCPGAPESRRETTRR